ncbi:NUDIX hydrolase [Acidicapsa acidisoli]|uniref:NUDIX hydrolase n=1 Tax=Acidicapsa acidisoli TaxID=1615681 RepID=UPI0021DFE374|nr:NUDIX hydrolase [Acidicapsa acidisoli]
MTAKKKSTKSTTSPLAAGAAADVSAEEVVAVVSGNPTKSARAAKPAKSTKTPAKIPKAKSPKAAKAAKPSVAPSVEVKAPAKAGRKTTNVAEAKPKPKAVSRLKAGIRAGADKDEKEQILDSQVAYEGKLFRVLRDHIIEPGGRESHRDVIRHNGSVVILAVDPSKRKKDPWIVIERQYRHAAGQFLWELPAGKLDAGEAPLDGAKRELAEETGYQARKWSSLFFYYASPGFLGESMNVFLAEGLVAGDAHPEEDEHIDFRLAKLSDVLDMVDKGKIIDGKTLTTVLLYARQLGLKRKK